MTALPDLRMAGVIAIDLFSIDVAIFRSEKARHKVLRKQGCDDLDRHSDAALASAHRDFTASGQVRFSMVIKPEASLGTWAHECSHMADFILDHFHIPLGIENTEIRAYLIGYLFDNLIKCGALS